MIKARPTVYRGIQMRSRLEAKAARAFDRVGAWWLYEPLCYANARTEYLPDFVVDSPVNVVDWFGRHWQTTTFWEVKYSPQLGKAAALTDMPVIWDGSARVPLIAWVPDTHQAWVATPNSSKLDEAARGKLWLAEVAHCVDHGISLMHWDRVYNQHGVPRQRETCGICWIRRVLGDGADEFLSLVGPIEQIDWLSHDYVAELRAAGIPLHPNQQPIYTGAAFGLWEPATVGALAGFDQEVVAP